MSEANGSHVTWRELNLLRGDIDRRFTQLEADIAEIKWGINVVLENRKAQWRSWGPPLLAALIAALVSVPVALLTH